MHLKKIGSDEHLSKAFDYFDKDGSGFIEVDELREALEGDLGPNEQIIKEIISDVDKDNVGLFSSFNYSEFSLGVQFANKGTYFSVLATSFQ